VTGNWRKWSDAGPTPSGCPLPRSWLPCRPLGWGGTGTPVHIMRVSTARSVQLIQDAKHGEHQRALDAFATDTKAVSSYDTGLRLEPPLGNPAAAARQCAWVFWMRSLLPTPRRKTVAFAEAPAGAIGLETGRWHNLWKLVNGQPWNCGVVLVPECLQQTQCDRYINPLNSLSCTGRRKANSS